MEKGLTSCYYSEFVDSTFGKAVSRKAEKIKINYLSEVFPLPEADFIYIYLPSMDTILHKHYKGEAFKAEKELIEFQIKLLWKRLPRKRRLVILSDHGLTGVRQIYKLPTIHDIYPVGGGRVAFYKNVEKSEVERRLKKAPVEVFHLKEIGDFSGRISKRCYENYGETIVLAKEGVAFQYPFEKEEISIKGFHGGFLKEEYYVNVWVTEKK